MSERIDIQGQVKKVGEVQTFGTFNKRELWLEIERDSKYPQTISVEFTQDNTSKLDSINESDEVEVSINLRGRYHEGTDRVYNTLTGWFIKKLSEGASAPAPSEPVEPPADTEGDIPF